MTLTYRYMGQIIFRNTEAGNRLRYSVCTASGMFSADTLAGIKDLIRVTLAR